MAVKAKIKKTIQKSKWLEMDSTLTTFIYFFYGAGINSFLSSFLLFIDGVYL